MDEGLGAEEGGIKLLHVPLKKILAKIDSLAGGGEKKLAQHGDNETRAMKLKYGEFNIINRTNPFVERNTYVERCSRGFRATSYAKVSQLA